MSDEEVLTGGSVSHIVRVGDTVLRPTGPWTPSVHAFLGHLERSGFGFAPRVLDVDEQGREVLTFLPGTPMFRPWPEELRDLSVLDQVGRVLRLLGDAASRFEPPPGARWRSPPLARTGPVRHGDVGPWNAIFDGGRLVGFIDWDFAEPAPPLWDLAQAAWYFVPLRPDGLGWRAAGFPSEPDLGERLARLCASFGAPRADVLDELAEMQQVELWRTQTLGAQGLQPWSQFLRRGDAEELLRESEWLQANGAQLGRRS